MKRVINCFKEDNPVINKKLRKVSVDEGLEIAKELFNILSERKDGLGLAANQIGYDASVAVVNVKEPIILINPVIKEQWDEVPYYEGCLSYPQKGIKTKRYRNVIVHTEQEEGDCHECGENKKDRPLGGLYRYNKDDMVLVRDYIERQLTFYSSTKSITPIWCDTCQSLKEYKSVLDDKKRY